MGIVYRFSGCIDVVCPSSSRWYHVLHDCYSTQSQMYPTDLRDFYQDLKCDLCDKVVLQIFAIFLF